MIRVVVEKIEGHCNLPMLVGDTFYVDGSRLLVPPGKHVCIWALQSMMPVFPLFNEREKLDDSHWVKKVRTFSCPDPRGRVIYRLEAVSDD